MKLTTRSRYGLRAMVYIAAHQTEETPVALSRIAEALALSEPYLEQLLRLLKKDQFVTSTRGVKGGYVLSRPAEEITVLDLLNTLEGEFWLSDCAVAGDCPGGFSNCPTRLVIHRMNRAIYDSISHLTLADMEQTWNAV
ncbi:MAG: Rrf2 family transcriptional regulator [Peptoniphilaceae bacterium]|nr:Rrf2 family transcriptional regulator [Peptoniphilaceae bacterium]MDY6085607.1 Rrf2 family transcriptional regulator [Peptoniphilaceae bacterium]